MGHYCLDFSGKFKQRTFSKEEELSHLTFLKAKSNGCPIGWVLFAPIKRVTFKGDALYFRRRSKVKARGESKASPSPPWAFNRLFYFYRWFKRVSIAYFKLLYCHNKVLWNVGLYYKNGYKIRYEQDFSTLVHTTKYPLSNSSVQLHSQESIDCRRPCTLLVLFLSIVDMWARVSTEIYHIV